MWELTKDTEAATCGPSVPSWADVFLLGPAQRLIDYWALLTISDAFVPKLGRSNRSRIR
jgi:hypothetical protein